MPPKETHSTMNYQNPPSAGFCIGPSQMDNTMPEPLSSSAAGAYAASQTVGGLKLFAAIAGVVGAVLMIVIRPNLTRKQMALHAFVAAIVSVFATGPAIAWVGPDAFKTWEPETQRDLYLIVALVLGALSWGFVGALYYIREKLGTNPIEAIQEWRNMRSGGASVMGAVRVSLAPKAPITAGGPSGTGNEGKYD